jgi:hypothetical protein
MLHVLQVLGPTKKDAYNMYRKKKEKFWLITNENVPVWQNKNKFQVSVWHFNKTENVI